MSAAVYRAFDADGRLLYIGATTLFQARVHQHARASEWWPEVATLTVEHYASRDDAMRAEAAAITAERPPYNCLHHPDREHRDARKPQRTNHRALELRLNAGLTQRELAARASVSPTTVRRIESGDVDMRESVLRRVADYFGIQVTDLLPLEREAA